MAEISAAMVKALREKTDAPMMECKKALNEAEGDLDKAEEILRVKLGNKASKAADRVAAEGVIGSFISPNGKLGAILELNCETDFVTKNDDFIGFSKKLAQLVADNNPADVEALNALNLDGKSDGQSVEEFRRHLVGKIGENMSIRRFKRFETSNRLAQYLHGNRIGVMVEFTANDDAIGRDVAMHIAATKPVCVSQSQVDATLVEKERAIYTQQAAESGKPADIVAKMVDGRINKYLAEISLLGQNFVKSPDDTVEKVLKQQQASVQQFQLYVVGEGIEKKVVDFAAEVAAAAAAA